MPNITTVAGDCFASIAKAQGFFNYLSIHGHADNAAKFPNPNQVEVGSTVKVPEKQIKAFDLPLDTPKKFKVVRYKTKLQLNLCKADVAQVPDIASATLVIGGKKASGSTGVLEIDDIDPALTAGSLKLVLKPPAAYAAAPATTAAVANQHPPAIVATDFDDPKTIWPKAGATITWQLEVGHLEPHTVTRGVLQRLQNLGFNSPVAQAEDAATQRAVKCYRRSAENKASPADTSAVADIRAHIKSRHDD
jgi:hypothetical protein